MPFCQSMVLNGPLSLCWTICPSGELAPFDSSFCSSTSSQSKGHGLSNTLTGPSRTQHPSVSSNGEVLAPTLITESEATTNLFHVYDAQDFPGHTQDQIWMRFT